MKPSRRGRFNGIHQPIVIRPEELHSEEKSAGRPSKYLQDPERYCILIIFFMSQGMTKEAASVRMGVCPMTLLNWEAKGVESEGILEEQRTSEDGAWIIFLGTLKRGEMYRQIWWEEMGRTNLKNANFNSTLWMMNMSNLFRGEKYDKLRGAGWTRDSNKLEITGKLNHNHLHTPGKLDLSKFDKEEKELFLGLVRKATTKTATV